MNSGTDSSQIEIRPFNVTHRLVLSIAIPMTFGFLTVPLLGLTDTAVAGHLGKAELIAGLAIGAVLFDLLFTTLNFLRSATTGLTAQAYGRGDQRRQQAVFWRSFLLSLALGFGIIVLSPLILKAGLLVIGGSGAVAETTTTYFNIRILAAPASLANMTILGFVLGRGQGTTGLVLQTVINGTNILLCILLGLHFGWGIAGIATATVTGEVLGVVVGLGLIIWKFDRSHRPSWNELVNRVEILALFGLNRDIMIRSFLLLGCFALQTRIGASFGSATLAANAVLMNIFLIAGYYLDGLANAAEQLVGRSIGAQYSPAFDRSITLTRNWSFGLAAVTTLFFLFAGHWIITILTSVAEVQDLAFLYLPWAAAAALSGALAFQLDGVFIGATWSKDMRNMMIIATMIYIISLAVLVPAFGNHGLWLALNIFLVARGLLLQSLLPLRRSQAFLPAQ